MHETPSEACRPPVGGESLSPHSDPPGPLILPVPHLAPPLTTRHRVYQPFSAFCSLNLVIFLNTLRAQNAFVYVGKIFALLDIETETLEKYLTNAFNNTIINPLHADIKNIFCENYICFAKQIQFSGRSGGLHFRKSLSWPASPAHPRSVVWAEKSD